MIWLKDFNVKVWEVKPQEKYTDLRISTSKKEKDGSYGQSSNWFPRCVGKAANQAAKFKEGDYVRVKNARITNETYEKDGVKKRAFSMVIFEFEPMEKKGVNAESEALEGDTDDLPY